MRPTSRAQAEPGGGGGLGLAVQPAAEQRDAAQQYANEGTAETHRVLLMQMTA